jgi:Alpha/beta hydrolase domain/FG-GAP-like repeat
MDAAHCVAHPRALRSPFRTTIRNLMRLGTASLLAAGAVAAASTAQAGTTGIQKVTILSSGPAFGGYSFGGVGTYTVIKGYALDAVNPTDPKNALITDINLAPRDANGNVDILFNFYMIIPTNLANGNGKVMYEPPNRGGKQFGAMNRSTGGNDPASVTNATALANTFLWPQGYATVFSGWEYEGDPTSPSNLVASMAGTLNGSTPLTSPPVAFGPNNATIVGPGYEYIVSPGATYTLSYPAASGNQGAPDAVLTHRVHLDDVAQVVPTSGWQYTDATNSAIQLVGSSFAANDIYEFSYIAKNPTVNGIGFAGIRDFMSWLRYSTQDNFGTPNPLAGYIQRVYTDVVSQPARTLNDFTYLGFNQDLNGRKVFDGMLQWVGAADGISMNYRWSQPTRTERNRQEELFQEGVFPFADVSTYDPISQSTDWRFKRCEATATCPLMMEMWSANEYWVKAASLFHTDPTGTYDLPDHPMTRKYFLSGSQHAGPGNPASRGACQQFLNPLDPQQVERALWVDLDQWSTKGVAPPDSQIPTLASGLLVPPIPQSGMGFPTIPGVTYTGLKTTRYRFNYGPNFYETLVPTYNPPVVTPPMEDNPANGQIYPSFIPKTDADGNDIGGIRLPELTVPLATYTGWALRSGAWANDGCESSGQYIPFQPTQAARVNAGDPRLSVAERYVTYAAYQSQVVAAVNKLVEQRLFNCDDTQPAVVRLLTAGLTAGVPPNVGNLQPPNPIPACAGRPSHDLNGDGASDIVWMDGSGNFAVWLMDGSSILAAQPIGTLPTWTLVGQRDFNGDGMADLLWRDGSGNVAMWFMQGGAVLSSSGLGNVPPNWSVFGTGDMNGDGIGDILWRDTTSGNLAVWFMNGTAVVSTANLGNVPMSWTIAATDGKGNIFWQDGSNNYAIWNVNGSQVTANMLGNVPSNWTLAGVGDFNGDGFTDILWRDATDGAVAIWFLNGTAMDSVAGFSGVPANFQIAQTGDYNGDGKTDILWNDGSGHYAAWFMEGASIASTASLGAVTGWTVQSQNAE